MEDIEVLAGIIGARITGVWIEDDPHHIKRSITLTTDGNGYWTINAEWKHDYLDAEVHHIAPVTQPGRQFTLKPLPDYGRLYTLEDWLSNVREGGFIDYDGSGLLATSEMVTDIYVIPSMVVDGKLPYTYGMTHVMWFNR